MNTCINQCSCGMVTFKVLSDSRLIVIVLERRVVMQLVLQEVLVKLKIY